ncbi:unnamed protein product [Rotaria magnacalcarata]|uniref:Dual specificity phosphatase catalytic domain-containing protein n=2 Tax=Rotaria magnacalcarata TaxID=392030 RepID=A0A8S2URN6_9BILA|nr:unnamed protein product [Rotaria magnacalcarata]
MTNDNFTDDDLYYDLRQNMHVTSEETNYLERLHEFKSTRKLRLIDTQVFDVPSMINDDFLYHAGISRSFTIVLAYLLKYQHKTLLEAYDSLTERRRLAELNDDFLLQLIRYEKELYILTS